MLEASSREALATIDQLLEGPSFDWALVAQKLRHAVGQDVYEAWFLSLKYESYGTQKGIVTLSVANSFLQRWVSTHYLQQIAACLVDVLGDEYPVHDVRIRFRVAGAQAKIPARSLERHRQLPAPTAMAPTPPHKPVEVWSPLNPDFQSESFRVHDQNRLAHTTIQWLLANTASSKRLPAYIYGASGLGKSHLLHSFARECTKQGKSVHLWSPQHRLASSPDQQTNCWESEVIIVDRIDTRGPHDQEMHHILMQALARHAQVLVAATSEPKCLAYLSQELLAAFTSGIVVEMLPFEDAAKCMVFDSLVERIRVREPEFAVPDMIATQVILKLPGNGNSLQGFSLRLLTHFLTHRCMPDIHDVDRFVQTLCPDGIVPRIKIDDVQKCVCAHFGVSKTDLLSQRRHRTVVWPRQVGMYLCKVLTTHSLPEVGRRFGGKDHTTVLHAIRKVVAIEATDTYVADDLRLLRRRLRPTHD